MLELRTNARSNAVSRAAIGAGLVPEVPTTYLQVPVLPMSMGATLLAMAYQLLMTLTLWNVDDLDAAISPVLCQNATEMDLRQRICVDLYGGSVQVKSAGLHLALVRYVAVALYCLFAALVRCPLCLTHIDNTRTSARCSSTLQGPGRGHARCHSLRGRASR